MAPHEAPTDPALEELRAFGLTYPGAHTKSPWPGHLDLAVNDKTFAYLSVAGDPFKLSCKLPHSCDDALGLPFVSPTPYGLGKSGWVTAQLPAGPVPVELFKAWIDESYRAQAPKRLVAALAAGAGAAVTPAAASSSKAAARPARAAVGKKRTLKKRAGKKAVAKPPAKSASGARAKPAVKRAPAKKKRRSA
jgi:predicted DNA-binding protein (MmcQ/YjbR family)